MKQLFLKLTFLIPFVLFGQAEKTVLFIGNSYTYVNNLPDLVNQIAIDKGNQLIYETHTPGGSTLSQHASNSNVQYLLETTEWDYVVLQEQSQYPSFPPAQVSAEVYPYAESLCEDIRETNPCSEPVFFMTWGRENGDSQNCAFYPPICTYEGMQERLTESYTEMAENNESLLAPVGIAWKNIREEHPEIDLYSGDGSHPSMKGSYLAACVFYSILFSDDPTTEYYPDGMNNDEAEIIQEFALNAISETTTDFTLQVEAIASYEILDDEIQFFNESTNASTITWTGLTQDVTSNEDTLLLELNGSTGIYEIILLADDGCQTSELLIQINDLAGGCTQEWAENYNPEATVDDGSCVLSGCSEIWADNYNPNVTNDDGSCELTACPYSNYLEYNNNYTIADASMCQTWITEGCTNPVATNYNPEANVNDGSCVVIGCMNSEADNFNPEATIEEQNSCIIYGCTNSTAENYNDDATIENGTCIIYGCTLSPYSNYNPEATDDDGSCNMGSTEVYGCTDQSALNYNSQATIDNGACEYMFTPEECEEGFSIILLDGWNLIGYSCVNTINAETAFAPLIDILIIAKDNAGNAYLPEWNFNGIGDLLGGYGYQLKITEQVNNFNICE